MSTSSRWKIMSVTLIVLVIAAAVLYLGSGKPIGLFTATVSTTGTSETSFRSTETCRRGDVVPFGDFLLYSDFWGAPVGEPQTVVCMKTFSSESFGWNWSRPSPSTTSTIYPQVVWGRESDLAMQEKSTTERLPVAVGSLISLELTLDVSTHTDGEYDLSFDIWMTNSSSAPGNALSSTHEIMIWLLWSPSQAGHSIEQVPTHGTVDDGHATYYHRDLGRPHGIWELHIFTKQEQGIPDKIDFVPFFHHLMAEGNYTQLRYLSAIDFGNEIWSGKGETMVTTYRFDVKATMQSLQNEPLGTLLESLHMPFVGTSIMAAQQDVPSKPNILVSY